MADICDLAQAAEGLHLAAALGKHLKMTEEPDEDGDGTRYCLTCAAVIPVERVAAVNAVRCVDCQTAVERRQRLVAA